MKTIKVSDETYNLIKDQIKESEANLKDKKKINITIKNRWTGDIIFESEKTTYREAVEEAVKLKANLSEADLYRANLSEANLSGADLSEANLSGADLSEASLSEADLSEANLSEANLYGANLYRANLSGADLYGANLSEADLYRARFYGKGGTTKIKKSQLNDFLKALGIILED
jgi:uncharacterized protein YjbI with pentapeptide repeats